MKAEPDITVSVLFHREGAFAIAALASFNDLVNVARAAGLAIETQAILDRPDELTSHILDVRGRWIDAIEQVSFGMPALSRNAGTRLAHGRFLAFLDGDDLWGEKWLRAAFAAATMAAAPQDVIWHPEYLYVFSESDSNKSPEAGTESFHSFVRSSDTPGFNPAFLVFHNFWSVNAFAARMLYLRFPYRAIDWKRGLGIEDWSWNLDTLAAGVHHRAVPGTVHLLRKKDGDSQSKRDTATHLLPYLPRSFVWA